MIFESLFFILYASGFHDFNERVKKFDLSFYESDSDHESDLRTRLAAQRSEHTRALEETKRTHAHELQALKQELATKVQTERSYQEQLAAMRRQLQQQIETHRKALADKDAAHAVVLAAKDDTIDAHVRTLAAKQDECQALLDDQTESNQLFEALEVQLNTLSEDQERLETDLAAQTGLTDTERRQKLALEERIAGLERYLEEAKRSAVQGRRASLESQVELAAQARQHQEALQEQARELEGLALACEHKQRRITQLEQRLRDTQQEHEEAIQEKDADNARLETALDERTRTLDEVRAILEERIRQHRLTLQEQAEAHEQMHKEMLDRERDDKERALAQLEQRLRKAEDDMAFEKEKALNFQRERDKAQKELGVSKLKNEQTIRDLKSTYEMDHARACRDYAARLEETEEAGRKDKAMHTQQISGMIQSMQLLQQDAAASRGNNIALEKEITQLRSRLDGRGVAMVHQLESQESQFREIIDHIEHLQRESTANFAWLWEQAKKLKLTEEFHTKHKQNMNAQHECYERLWKIMEQQYRAFFGGSLRTLATTLDAELSPRDTPLCSPQPTQSPKHDTGQ